MSDNLISRAEMFKALGIEYHGPDVLLDKKILESQIANKEYDRRTEITWDIRGKERNMIVPAVLIKNTIHLTQ